MSSFVSWTGKLKRWVKKKKKTRPSAHSDSDNPPPPLPRSPTTLDVEMWVCLPHHRECLRLPSPILISLVPTLGRGISHEEGRRLTKRQRYEEGAYIHGVYHQKPNIYPHTIRTPWHYVAYPTSYRYTAIYHISIIEDVS